MLDWMCATNKGHLREGANYWAETIKNMWLSLSYKTNGSKLVAPEKSKSKEGRSAGSAMLGVRQVL